MKLIVIRLKTLFTALAVIICICTVVGGSSTSVFKVNGREIPIYSVERDDNKIALTFDCAWNADDIAEICDTLDKYNAKATFFAVGDWAERYPDAVKLLFERGHEIGSHSYNHAHYAKLSAEQMTADMQKCDSILKDITGNEVSLFRAPYGEYNDMVVKTCESTGRIYVQWSVDSIDYGKTTKEDIIRRSTQKTKNGDIILMHNGTENTLHALPEILSILSEKHELVTVSELIYKENYTIDHAGRQYKNKS